MRQEPTTHSKFQRVQGVCEVNRDISEKKNMIHINSPNRALLAAADPTPLACLAAVPAPRMMSTLSSAIRCWCLGHWAAPSHYKHLNSRRPFDPIRLVTPHPPFFFFLLLSSCQRIGNSCHSAGWFPTVWIQYYLLHHSKTTGKWSGESTERSSGRSPASGGSACLPVRVVL